MGDGGVVRGVGRLPPGLNKWSNSNQISVASNNRLVLVLPRFIGNREPNRQGAGCFVMMTRQTNHRMATTAIAAALAFSSTPLLAQDTQPVTDPVAETPVTATPDPLAPAPVPAETPPPAEPTAEATAESETTAEPESAATTAPVAHRATTSRATNRGARTPTSAAAPAAAAPAAAPAETPTAAPEPVAAAPTMAADPFAEPPVPAPEPAATSISDDALPIAGAVGLGLFALAGAGMAMRRRNRRRDEEEAEWVEVEAEPVVAHEPTPVVQPRPVADVHEEPAFARRPAPVHDPVPTDAPVTALPAGFDVSRFGRHVQAAYRGPSPDNPSLSLKNRLRRAAFFDQQERRAAAEAPEAAIAEAPAGGWALRKDDEFLFRRAGTKPVRPAFQH